MKNITIVALLLSLLAITSCKKNDTAHQTGGSWTVSSNTYTASIAKHFSSTAIDASTSDGRTLRIAFHNSAPAADGSLNGTYNVIKYWGSSLTDNEVYFWSYDSGSFLFGSAGGGTVTVTTSNGIVNISGSGIPVAASSGSGTQGASLGDMTFNMFY